jgi:hypothetical protein
MNLISWSIPPQYIMIVLSFVTLAFIILCTVMVIGILKRRHLKAAGWFKDMGFSLEASDRDELPNKD